MRTLLLALGIFALVASPAPAQPRRGQQAANHGWLFSLEAGKAEARLSGKPLMVVVRCEP